MNCGEKQSSGIHTNLSSFSPEPSVSCPTHYETQTDPDWSSSTVSPMTKPLPITSARWRQGPLLGQGSSGRVYLGLDQHSGALLAVKVSLSSDSVQLGREIDLLAHLRHPNIVQYLGMETNLSGLALFLEYVSGGSIDGLLKQFGPLFQVLQTHYTRQLLCGVKYLHLHRIVHGDLKGANLLLTDTGCLKLADFGSAHSDSAPTSTQTRSVGTPEWMAPEAITGHGSISSDIWSVGCVVLEMAQAKSPWATAGWADPKNACYSIVKAHTSPPVPPALFSEQGHSFLAECLKINAQDRPRAADLLNHHWLIMSPTKVRRRRRSSSDLSHASPTHTDSSSDQSNNNGPNVGAVHRVRKVSQSLSVPPEPEPAGSISMGKALAVLLLLLACLAMSFLQQKPPLVCSV
eukprot:NODE_1890_length_1344_cov_33.820049_g1795_i0.p1 GENE.NODE_1890_length_1344_cov_33.820049_g1795_i0~~NODE_1890_length_1344_cov_33.820049_g1795_i0.p1  ORF type:complete len:414 (-),score=73.03 NODE_1890_length_1344_cov_33.820049_g1795_i0:101-1312(-)